MSKCSATALHTEDEKKNTSYHDLVDPQLKRNLR